MTVALPDGFVNDASMYFIDRGGVLTPSLGGPDQRMDRVGSKWGGVFQTKPMKGEDARIWIARLVRGVREKASVKFPQPGLKLNVTGTFTVRSATAANVSTIPASAALVGDRGKTLKEGQFISVIQGGQRYVYQLLSDTVINGDDGTIVLSVQPYVRVSLTVGSVIEIVTPRIEGFVKNDDFRWTIDNAKIYGLQFTLNEAQ